MSSVWVIAASTIVVAYGVTWCARYVAPKIGFLDTPDGAQKVHQYATPLLGGLAVYLSFAVGLLALVVGFGWGIQDNDSRNFFMGVLISGGLFCCLGLCDDRWPLRARYKFLLQIMASMPFVLLGPSITKLSLLGLQVDLGMMAVPFTIFWIVSCVNIVNLMDGMDGLAATIGLIAAATLAFLSFSFGQFGLATIGLIFSASLLGFLFHNWPPARIFLGDAGSLTIGFVIGALSTGAALKTATGFVLIFPTVLLAIPIADTTLAIVRRKLMGQGIGDGDRGHIHHRLQECGLSKVNSLLVIASLCVAMATVVAVAGRIQSDWLALVLGSAVLVAGFLSRRLGLHELHLANRSLRILVQVGRNASARLRTKMSSMRLATSGLRNAELLWSLVEEKAALAGAVKIELVIEEQSSGTHNVVRQWSCPEIHVSEIASWDIQYRVPRSHGAQIALQARGRCSNGEEEEAFESLAHLCSEICRTWPTDSPAILSIADHRAGAEPDILQRSDEQADSQHQVTGKRAA